MQLKWISKVFGSGDYNDTVPWTLLTLEEGDWTILTLDEGEEKATKLVLHLLFHFSLQLLSFRLFSQIGTNQL